MLRLILIDLKEWLTESSGFCAVFYHTWDRRFAFDLKKYCNQFNRNCILTLFWIHAYPRFFELRCVHFWYFWYEHEMQKQAPKPPELTIFITNKIVNSNEFVCRWRKKNWELCIEIRLGGEILFDLAFSCTTTKEP